MTREKLLTYALGFALLLIVLGVVGGAIALGNAQSEARANARNAGLAVAQAEKERLRAEGFVIQAELSEAEAALRIRENTEISKQLEALRASLRGASQEAAEWRQLAQQLEVDLDELRVSGGFSGVSGVMQGKQDDAREGCPDAARDPANYRCALEVYDVATGAGNAVLIGQWALLDGDLAPDDPAAQLDTSPLEYDLTEYWKVPKIAETTEPTEGWEFGGGLVFRVGSDLSPRLGIAGHLMSPPVRLRAFWGRLKFQGHGHVLPFVTTDDVGVISTVTGNVSTR
jgi:hypothetical protein